MKFIYCSNVCSEEVYKKLFANSNNKPGQQVQKYHRTLLKGFSGNEIVKVKAISKMPVQKENCNRVWINGFTEKWHDIEIQYMPMCCSIPKVAHLFQILTSFFYMMKEKKDKDTIALLDVLNISMGIGVSLACRIRHIKLIGIVTDLPEMLSGEPSSKFVKVCKKIIASCDGYLLLTEEMNEVVNPNGKPYIVIEGQVDPDLKIDDNPVNKYSKKVSLYSGSLNRIHGIPYLVDGFLKAKIPDAELHIYGNGDYEEELVAITKKHSSIKYFGVKLNDEVVKAQRKATLLINPRPTNQEFVKYSFPSKNMEYLASGTAMLTTRLPGMPKEYYPYVYILDDETATGMSEMLTEILNQDKDTLIQKGNDARNFVLEHKNGKVQAQKIIGLARILLLGNR